MSSTGSSAGRGTVIIASAILAIAIGYGLTTIPYGRAFHDLFVLLDGAYRISIGHIPHVDFASPFGPLLLYTMHWGQLVFPDGNAFVAYHVVAWVMILPAFLMLAPRFASNRAFLAGFGLLALIMLLPMTLDDTNLAQISYFATYNRFASGGMFLIGLWYVLPKRPYDFALLAYCLLFLLGIKITAAIVGFGIILCAVILCRVRWRQVALLVLVLALILLAVELLTAIPSGYVTDIVTMIKLNEGGGIARLLYAGVFNWQVLALTGCLVLVSFLRFYQDNFANRLGLFDFLRDYWTDRSYVIDVVLLVVAAWGAESQNYGNLGLIAAAAIFFHPAAWRDHRLVNGFLLAALLLPILDILVDRSLKIVARERIAAPVQPLERLVPGTRVSLSTYEGARFFGEIFRDKLPLAREVQKNRFFLTHDPAYNAPAAQLARMMDTVTAIKTFEDQGYGALADTYISIIFADPFARALGLTPAKGTMLTMDVDRTVPRFSPQQARAYLAKANGVFADRCGLVNDDLDFYFADVLAAEFDHYPLSPCWDFHVRKGSAQN